MAGSRGVDLEMSPPHSLAAVSLLRPGVDATVTSVIGVDGLAVIGTGKGA
jgi:hypothetical protein